MQQEVSTIPFPVRKLTLASTGLPGLEIAVRSSRPEAGLLPTTSSLVRRVADIQFRPKPNKCTGGGRRATKVKNNGAASMD
jgi:hypothetical protein